MWGEETTNTGHEMWKARKKPRPSYIPTAIIQTHTYDDDINPNASKTQPLARALAMRVNV